MNKYKEKQFETELVHHLTTHGWIEGDPRCYDRELALYPDHLLGWLQETQPAQWEKVVAAHGANAERQILERVTKLLDRDGTLHLLRSGFKDAAPAFSSASSSRGTASTTS